MSKRYIPFDRYNWDLRSLFLEHKIQVRIESIGLFYNKGRGGLVYKCSFRCSDKI